MRALESIDDELVLVAEIRRALRQEGCDPSLCPIDVLLDERLTSGDRVRGLRELPAPARR